MMTNQDALSKIEVHEKECALRFKTIEERLERGSSRMARLEGLIWTMYPFILASIYLSKDL